MEIAQTEILWASDVVKVLGKGHLKHGRRLAREWCDSHGVPRARVGRNWFVLKEELESAMLHLLQETP